MSEVSSTVFGLERADFTREARLLDKVSASVRDGVLGFGLMGVLRGLPKTATTQQVWDTIRESDQLVVVCEACSRDDVTATRKLAHFWHPGGNRGTGAASRASGCRDASKRAADDECRELLCRFGRGGDH